MEEADRIHVAAIPSTGSGHINPLLELCRLLVPLGFRVSLIYPANLCPQVESKLRGDDVHITLVPSPASDKLLLMDPEVQGQMKPVLEALHPPVRCLISDLFLGWSQDLADDLKIPRVALFTSDPLMEAFLYYIHELVSRGYIPPNASAGNNTLIDFIPGVEPFPKEMLPLAFNYAGPIMMTLADAAKRTKDAVSIVVNAVEELDPELVSGRRAEFSSYVVVGPLVSPTLLQEQDATAVSSAGDQSLVWLNQQAHRSVLYIAFGSVVSLKVAHAVKIAEAVNASGLPVLWAMRRKFADAEPERFYESLQDRAGTQALVVEWSPQTDVLRHPAVAAFWTHCGWNSALEALCTGVPMLCWPCESDQNVNADIIVNKWRTGTMATDGAQDDAKPEDLAKAMHAVVDGDEGRELRARADELKLIVREGTCRQKNLQELKDVIVAAISN